MTCFMTVRSSSDREADDSRTRRTTHHQNLRTFPAPVDPGGWGCEQGEAVESLSQGRRVRRLPVLLACGAMLVVGAAPPACAHANPGNYVSVITNVQPTVVGLEVSVESDGSFLTLTNRTGRTLFVAGYEDEAFLKITADGTWENTRSPTARLNAGDPVRDSASGSKTLAAPVWKQIATTNTYRYHDHRIGWTGKGRPSVVVNDVNAQHLIATWTIDVQIDRTEITINGTVTWVPTGFGLADTLFVVICVACIVGVLVALAVDSRRNRGHVI